MTAQTLSRVTQALLKLLVKVSRPYTMARERTWIVFTKSS